jgi:hypothetical protein
MEWRVFRTRTERRFHIYRYIGVEGLIAKLFQRSLIANAQNNKFSREYEEPLVKIAEVENRLSARRRPPTAYRYPVRYRYRYPYR